MEWWIICQSYNLSLISEAESLEKTVEIPKEIPDEIESSTMSMEIMWVADAKVNHFVWSATKFWRQKNYEFLKYEM